MTPPAFRSPLACPRCGASWPLDVPVCGCGLADADQAGEADLPWLGLVAMTLSGLGALAGATLAAWAVRALGRAVGVW
jgi:hypothetical protein